ncbi:MAG: hypothetical protein QM652_00615 [Legionella sp.]|uniref:hypothetical protein n=1 Tax=Legionella sp. TaxID=459 RepID=UPI0039E24B04
MTDLNIETLVLVAVWENPFIFQGCFKVTQLYQEHNALFFFRCQSTHAQQTDILHEDFSPYEYKFTHLYQESGPIHPNHQIQAHEDALYLLKYALHVTLKEMMMNRKLHFTSIDDVAMQTMINRIKPILNKELMFPEDEHIGFAVAMDFCPKEEMGMNAALTLLQGFQ